MDRGQCCSHIWIPSRAASTHPVPRSSPAVPLSALPVGSLTNVHTVIPVTNAAKKVEGEPGRDEVRMDMQGMQSLQGDSEVCCDY